MPGRGIASGCSTIGRRWCSTSNKLEQVAPQLVTSQAICHHCVISRRSLTDCLPLQFNSAAIPQQQQIVEALDEQDYQHARGTKASSLAAAGTASSAPSPAVAAARNFTSNLPSSVISRRFLADCLPLVIRQPPLELRLQLHAHLRILRSGGHLDERGAPQIGGEESSQGAGALWPQCRRVVKFSAGSSEGER